MQSVSQSVSAQKKNSSNWVSGTPATRVRSVPPSFVIWNVKRRRRKTSQLFFANGLRTSPSGSSPKRKLAKRIEEISKNTKWKCHTWMAFCLAQMVTKTKTTINIGRKAQTGSKQTCFWSWLLQQDNKKSTNWWDQAKHCATQPLKLQKIALLGHPPTNQAIHPSGVEKPVASAVNGWPLLNIANVNAYGCTMACMWLK